MTHRRLLPAALLITLCSVTGCAGAGETSEESRTRFYTALDTTQEALGGRWDNRDDPTPRGCPLPLWVRGETYPALRVGPIPDDVTVTLDAAHAALEELGYEVDGGEVGDVLELQGKRGSEIVIFRITDDGMTLQGESSCRPR
ncbi:hypothetical protein [Planctomonas psychrotolerans]|uniref:hypothetical protein n=1 Tax=Planctomonas psychrotolerans TaxID=2528712 RepID=UPI0012397E9E|nr:hypothetical protein [Planctomonas psychrotolerans]